MRRRLAAALVATSLVVGTARNARADEPLTAPAGAIATEQPAPVEAFPGTTATGARAGGRLGFLASDGTRGDAILAPAVGGQLGTFFTRHLGAGVRYDFAWHREGLASAHVTRMFHAVTALAYARARIHRAAELALGVGGGANLLHLVLMADAGRAFVAVEPHAAAELSLTVHLPGTRVFATLDTTAYARPSGIDRFHGVGLGARF